MRSSSRPWHFSEINYCSLERYPIQTIAIWEQIYHQSANKYANWDLLKTIRFFMMALDDIQKHFECDSSYIRTLLYEAKHFRNLWAHQGEFTLRQVYRVADTILLMAEGLNYDCRSETYQKIADVRDFCLKKLAMALTNC